MYLKETEVEEADWDVFSKIITDISIDLLMNHQATMDQYYENDETVIYINDLTLFPKHKFSTSSDDKFNNFYSEDYIESYTQLVTEGIIPFIELFLDKMPSNGSRREREMLSLISRKLKKSKEDKGNVFGLFKSSYMPSIKSKGHNFVNDSINGGKDENDSGKKNRKDRINILKTDIH